MGWIEDRLDEYAPKLAEWIFEQNPLVGGAVLFLPSILLLPIAFFQGSMLLRVSTLFALSGFSAMWGILVAGGALKVALRKQLLRLCRDIETVRRLDPIQFEAFCEDYLRDNGYATRANGGRRPDGGIDIIATRDEKRFAVQCKHYDHKLVDIEPVRALFGVMSRRKLDGAIFMTAGDYTGPARDEFRDDQRVILLDRSDISRWLEKLNESDPPIEKRSGLFSRLFEETVRPSSEAGPRITVPLCPKCKVPMVLRAYKTGKGKFWGCIHYASSNCGEMKKLEKEHQPILAPGFKEF